MSEEEASALWAVLERSSDSRRSRLTRSSAACWSTMHRTPPAFMTMNLASTWAMTSASASMDLDRDIFLPAAALMDGSATRLDIWDSRARTRVLVQCSWLPLPPFSHVGCADSAKASFATFVEVVGASSLASFDDSTIFFRDSSASFPATLDSASAVSCWKKASSKVTFGGGSSRATSADSSIPSKKALEKGESSGSPGSLFPERDSSEDGSANMLLDAPRRFSLSSSSEEGAANMLDASR
mmetsp:Transcript_37142/g.75733  ORF Transcript_37142/g.75733 Transcript_37142/m.75733 type:complete len:241 (-) Transcript_37142:55-777(-)